MGFKLIETFAQTEDGGEKIESMIAFIKKHFEKNQFNLQSSLADLDAFFEESVMPGLPASKE